MTDPFAFADDLGPEQVIHIHRPGIGLRAVLVVDNTACGAAIGGIRMAPDADAREAFRHQPPWWFSLGARDKSLGWRRATEVGHAGADAAAWAPAVGAP